MRNPTSSNHFQLTILDTETGAGIETIPVGKHPSSVAVNQQTHRVYVVSAEERTLTIVDGEHDLLLGAVALGAQPQYATLDSQSGRIYVSREMGEGTLSIIDDLTDVQRL
jgi:YVTN family beta-propeller protein